MTLVLMPASPPGAASPGEPSFTRLVADVLEGAGAKDARDALWEADAHMRLPWADPLQAAIGAVAREARTPISPSDSPDLLPGALTRLDPDVPPALQDAIHSTVATFVALTHAVESRADASTILQARARFLATVPGLRAAAAEAGQVPMPPLLMPPLLAIHLGAADDTHADDYALLIDAGGNDTYLNNAGGSDVGHASCVPGRPPQAAALIDLDGDDRYVGARGCGANGGAAYGGVGMLLDLEGHDIYDALDRGVNGGGFYGGLGLLLDAGGNDRYGATDFAVNGGGWVGTGLLVDASGDDAYLAGSHGANGGGSLGRGFLLDAAGHDQYTARSQGVNGGSLIGSGFLLDAGGNDRYEAHGIGANGGGFQGAGFLFDAEGDDVYLARDGATNGGGGRSGALLDAQGNDTYVAGGSGTNGGAFAGGTGFLIDGGGNDTYFATAGGVNGGAQAGVISSCPSEPCDDPEKETRLLSFGLLLDLGGRDHYHDSDPDAPGSGDDRSATPKGEYGAQVDVPTHSATFLPIASSRR